MLDRIFDRFWLWLRRNLDTEQIMKTTYAMNTRQQELAADLETVMIAVADLRKELNLDPLIKMDAVEQARTPAGDPSGL